MMKTTSNQVKILIILESDKSDLPNLEEEFSKEKDEIINLDLEKKSRGNFVFIKKLKIFRSKDPLLKLKEKIQFAAEKNFLL